MKIRVLASLVAIVVLFAGCAGLFLESDLKKIGLNKHVYYNGNSSYYEKQFKGQKLEVLSLSDDKKEILVKGASFKLFVSDFSNINPYAKLIINTNEGAVIKLDNKRFYRNGAFVKKGIHKLKISKLGYKDYEKDITVSKNQNLDINLEKLEYSIKYNGLVEWKNEKVTKYTDIIKEFNIYRNIGKPIQETLLLPSSKGIVKKIFHWFGDTNRGCGSNYKRYLSTRQSTSLIKLASYKELLNTNVKVFDIDPMKFDNNRKYITNSLFLSDIQCKSGRSINSLTVDSKSYFDDGKKYDEYDVRNGRVSGAFIVKDIGSLNRLLLENNIKYKDTNLNLAELINLEKKKSFFYNLNDIHPSVRSDFENLNNTNMKEVIEKSISILYGKPQVENLNYNTNTNTLSMDITSSTKAFKTTYNVKVKRNYGQRLKNILEVSSFKPTLLFEVKNNKLEFKGIKELNNIPFFVSNMENKLKVFKLWLANNHNKLDINMINFDNYSDKLVGTQTLNGAKFLGHKIWQDQPINAKRDRMDYNEAKNYCKNLNLLGFKEWELPSLNDFKMLDTDVKQLTYITKSSGSSWISQTYPYISNEIIDTTGFGKYKVKLVDMDNKYPKINSNLFKITNKSSIRCVLNPNIYNKEKIRVQKQYEQKGTLDGYLTAFSATGDKANIKKALKLAKTKKDKGKIEKALYNYLGASKVFEIKSNGAIISDDTKKFEADTFIFNSIQNSKNLKHKFSVNMKSNSALKLKYNSYKVKIRFNLKLKYTTVMKKALFGMNLADSKTVNIPVEKTFYLSKSNGYKDSEVIDFGSVRQGGRSSAIFLKVDTSLSSANIEYEILSSEVN